MSSLTKTQLLYEVRAKCDQQMVPTHKHTANTDTHADTMKMPTTHKLRITKCQMILWGFDLKKSNLFNVF